MICLRRSILKRKPMMTEEQSRPDPHQGQPILVAGEQLEGDPLEQTHVAMILLHGRGIDRVFAEVMPADKANYVKQLQGEGCSPRWWATVSMTHRRWPRQTWASPSALA